MEGRRRRTPPTVTPASTVRAPARPAPAPVSTNPLTGANGDPVTVVHLAAELAPFARTGGLGEAVSSLAHYQARSGITSIMNMPAISQFARLTGLAAIQAEVGRIASTQLPKLFGVEGGGEDFFHRIGHLVRQLPA